MTTVPKVKRLNPLELSILVAAIAVTAIVMSLAVRRPAEEPQAGIWPPDQNLRIDGLCVGMTEAQAKQRLGEPLDRDSVIHEQGYHKVQYARGPSLAGEIKERRGYGTTGDPEIVYNPEGRIVSISGSRLERDGKALPDRPLLSHALSLFPTATELWPPGPNTVDFGALYVPEKGLEMTTIRIDDRSETTVKRWTLSTPDRGHANGYWARPSSGDSLLARTGRQSLGCNETAIKTQPVTACFRCFHFLTEEPRFARAPGDREGRAFCPSCDKPGLLSGTRQEITPDYLRRVNRAWITPWEP